MENEVETCGRKAHPKFGKGGRLTPCVLEPGHEGNHVYYMHVAEGMDYHSSAGEFLEEVERVKLKPIFHVDLRGKAPLQVDEAAAVFAVVTTWGQL